MLVDVGAGALSLPYAFQHSGVAIGLLLLALTAAATHYSVVPRLVDPRVGVRCSS